MTHALKFFRPLAILVFALLCPAAALAAAQDAPRFAILIGNANYPKPLDLPNPVNDIRAMSGVLAELGFQVSSLENGTRLQMRAHVRDAMSDVPDGAVVLFFYAGHAIQKNGVNWLLPTDFRIPENESLDDVALGIDEVIREIDEAKDATKIIVLDACRDYPLGKADEALGNGLAGVFTRGETLIAYATLSGEVAGDGTGPNSPYTGALVSALDIQGLELHDVFRTVRYKVRSATGGLQLPWVSGALNSDLVLNPRGEEETPEELIRIASLDPVQAVHWRAISRSSNPGDFRTFAVMHETSPARELAVERERALMRLSETALPAIEIQDERPAGAPFAVTACDKWVSDPLDPRRIAPGVPWGLVNTRDAIRDCSIALARDPENPRLSFLLARALDIAESFDDARLFYERAASQGYGAAHRNLGFMYRNARGTAPDDALAARYYFTAALDGVVDARKALAKLYEQGWGVQQSYPEMLRWLELSAEDDYPNSLDHLGNLYRVGEYVTQNHATALEYYERAASLGYGNGIANVARVYRDGLGVEVDRNRAMALYEDATATGNAFAPYHLARMMLRPADGEIPDPARAQELLELSAERGYAWALWQLARSWNSGDFGERDLDTAAFYLWIAAEAGRSMRTSGGVKLVADATDMLKTIEPRLSQERRDAIELRTQQWLKQNSLLNFSLIFPY